MLLCANSVSVDLLRSTNIYRKQKTSLILLIDHVLFQEMTAPITPLAEIAQTPRKETESKFTFNPHLAKVGESGGIVNT